MCCVTGVFVGPSCAVYLLQSLLDMVAVAVRENELAAKADERRKKREAQEKKRWVSFFLLLSFCLSRSSGVFVGLMG